jgi:hypothetical protein
VNFLRRFITNPSGKIIPFTPILRLKNEAEFTWGTKQQATFDLIKHYLSTPPVLRAPKSGEPFQLYIAVQEGVIGVVLMQEFKAKEHIITYVSRRLVDVKQGTLLLRSCVFCYVMHVLN